jgi:hypothetical protein
MTICRSDGPVPLRFGIAPTLLEEFCERAADPLGRMLRRLCNVRR